MKITKKLSSLFGLISKLAALPLFLGGVLSPAVALASSAPVPIMAQPSSANVEQARQQEMQKKQESLRIREEKKRVMQQPGSPRAAFATQPVSVAASSAPSVSGDVEFLPSMLKDNEVPPSLRGWVDWVRQANAMKISCPANGTFPRNECVLPAVLSLFDQGDKGLKFTLRGESFLAGALYPLPGGNMWQIQNVSFNGKPANIVKREWLSKVVLEKGTFEVSGVLIPLSASAYDQLQIPPLLLQVDNRSTRPVLSNTAAVAPVVVDTAAVSQSSIRVFRLLRPGMPWQLSLRIEVNHAGPSKEESLGKLLPEGFSLSSLNSALPVSYKEGQYWVRLQSGQNWINMEAYTLKAPEVIETRGLSLSKEDWWAMQLQSNAEAWKVSDAKPVDIARLGVPAEFAGQSFYQVPAQLKISRESRGLRNEKSSLNIQRTSWLEPHNKQWVHREDFQSGHIFGWLNAQPGVKLESFQSNNVYYPLSFDEKTKGTPGVSLTTDIAGSIGRVVSPEGEAIPLKAWKADEVKVTNWDINFPPRWRLLGVSGATADESWVATWSLYDFFIGFIVILAIARLFSIPLAGLALLSMVIFHTQRFWALDLWFAIVASLVLLKVLGEGKLRSFALSFASVFWLLLSASWLRFIFQEVRYLVNPSLEQMHPHYQKFGSMWGGFGIVEILSILCFLGGLAFGIKSAIKLKEYKESQGKVPLSTPIMLGLVSAILIALPSFLTTGQESVFGASSNEIRGGGSLLKEASEDKLVMNMAVPAAPASIAPQNALREARAKMDVRVAGTQNALPLANASVGRGFPDWKNSYRLSVEPTATEAVSIFAASPLWVNATSLLQITILTMLLGWTGYFLLVIHGRQDLLKKLPPWVVSFFFGKKWMDKITVRKISKAGEEK